MRSIIYFALASILAVTTVAQSDERASLNAQTDKIFALWDRPESPGCALAVIRDGQIIYKRGYGTADLDHDIPITPASVFHVASVSKQFTALAIHLLAEQGKLSLDDEARKYIPELRGISAKITIRHLLHHTSGLRDQWNLLIMSGWRLSEDVVREQDVLDLVSRMKELNFQPGEQYAYSNTGYTLLAVIVKRVSGQSLREFSEANIFKPLGMTRTFFRDDHAVTVKGQAYAYINGPNNTFKLSVPNYDIVGASSLLTTVEDLARWDQNFYDYRVGGQRVIDRMQITSRLNSGEPIDYASGLVIGRYKGLRIVEHSGGDAGYRSHLMRFPDERFSVVCLCNVGNTNPGALARRVADTYLQNRLVAEASKTTNAPAFALTAEQLTAKAGAYWNEVTEELGRAWVQNHKLYLSFPGYNNSVTPFSTDRFSMTGQLGDVEFGPSTNGKPAYFTVRIGERSPAVFKAVPPAETSLDRLGEFVGNYYSDEIDATYRVERRETGLVVLRRKADPTPLVPAFRDGFSSMSILGTVRFMRDAGSGVNAMVLSAGRVRNFRFVRQAQ